MGYFKARGEREIRNNEDLHKLIKKLLKKDSAIKAYRNTNDPVFERVVFIKDESICSISFMEVPFTWVGPDTESATIKRELQMPYTVKDVLGAFKPITTIRHFRDYFRTIEQYLEWCSYLEPIK